MSGDARAHSSRGVALYRAGRLVEALAAFDDAVAADPNSALDLANRGSVLGDLGRWNEALVSAAKARSLLAPGASLRVAVDRILWSILARYGSDAGGNGQQELAFRLLSDAARLQPNDLETAAARVFALNYVPGIEPGAIRREAEAFGRLAASLSPPLPPARNIRDPERQIRLGFVSADFNRHPVARFLRPLARLNVDQIVPHVYFTGRRVDDDTDWFRSVLPNWRDIAGMNDEAVAASIRNDGIDVLCDLSGFSAGGRMGVFARRPAPVQFTWLGYFATTGLTAMDYVLGNATVLPTAEEAHWVERPWRLADTYLAFAPPAQPIEVGAPPSTDTGNVTFGSFNNSRKLTPNVLDVWARILSAVPNSRLVLRSSFRVSPEREEAIRLPFEARAIERNRIEIASAIQGYREHLEAYRTVDVALDPFPFAGATTTCEALWMGVPVITVQGDRYVGHMGENILSLVGRPEWIASDLEQYVELAINLARDHEQLALARQALRDDLIASPIGDLDAFATNFAAAVRGMWREWCRR